MRYNKFSRPPLSRNKYGFVNQTNIIGSSAYYTNNGSSFNGNVDDVIAELKDFTGATEYDDGVRGLVPAPIAGMQDYYFLKADGTWTYDPSYKWLHEWPDIGDPKGLEIDGDFNVTGTLNTMDLNVQGQAHFWELVIDKVRANGGQVIVSPSLFEVDWVGGTQIYDFGFKANPFYEDLSSIYTMQDWTQWTDSGYKHFGEYREEGRPVLIGQRAVPYSDIIYFFNRNETNIPLDKFRDFCKINGLFAGRDVTGNAKVSNGEVIGDGGIGWGAYYTGLFEKDMRDEDGKLLPLRAVNSLPYDFDKHYLDYYKLVANQESTRYVDSVTWLPEGWHDQRTCWVSVKCMTSDLKMEFQNENFGTLDAWAKVVYTRPDIWYRFFSDKINWTSPIDSYTEPEDLPVWSEWKWHTSEGSPTETYPMYIKPFGFMTNGFPQQTKSYENGWKIQYFAKRLWMRCDDGSRRTFNECQIGDMLRCRSFNIKEGAYKNVSNKDFWSFVVGTGEGSYTDDDGNSYEAFYVDLVYAMKYETPNGSKYYPIGTLFKNKSGEEGSNVVAWVNPLDSTNGVDVEIPEGWDQNIVQILNLKNVSKDTLTGLRDCIEEFPTDEEFNEAVDLVLQIRGGISNLSEFAGTDMGDTGRTMNSIRREQEATAFITNGTLPTSAGDLSQLILDGQFSDDSGDYSEIELDDAQFYAYNTIKGYRGADDIPSQEGDQPDINAENSESELPGGQFISTEGRKLKINETHHNYCSKDYYSQYKFGYGKWNVSVGDSFACLGNLNDPMRQNAIVISSVNPIDPELEAPSIAQYHLIDVFGVSISRFRYTTIAHNGNTFFGSFNIDTGTGAYMQLDDKINFYITDIITGLEKVGIHLDGDNSTIKMIGNIELHQHADGDDDTLSVFDSKERKRVEILPSDIPNRNSQDAILAQVENRTIANKFTTWRASKSYIHYEETGSVVGSIFGNPRRAKYALNLNFEYLIPGFTMPTYSFTCTDMSPIGFFGVDSDTDVPCLDVSNLNLKIDISDAYLLYGGSTERNLQRYIPITSIVGDNGYVNNLTVNLIKWANDINQYIVVATKAITAPSYNYTTTDGKIINISVGGLIFDDIEMDLLPNSLNTWNYGLQYSVDVYPFCYVENIGRSQDYSFNGTASVVGNYTITYDRRDGSSQGTVLSTALSHMTIGTNGMVFNTSNSRYFYAADDGVEIKWDDVKLTLDSGGVRIVPGIKVYDPYYMQYGGGPVMIIQSSTGIGQLPAVGSYGLGRRLTVIGGERIDGDNLGLGNYETITVLVPTFNVSYNKIRYTSAVVQHIELSDHWEWDTTNSTMKICNVGPTEFIAGNGTWYLIGGFLNSIPLT